MGRLPKNPVPPAWERILQGREFSPFLESIGLDTGSGASRLREGKFPDPQILIPAIRLERISLSWLVDGQGTPFMVLPIFNDADAANIITNLLEDEPNQTVTLVRTEFSSKQTVVFTQPAQLVRGRHTFDYTAVEVLGGNIGNQALKAIVDHARGKLRLLHIAPASFVALTTGQMGNVPLIGWSRQPGGLLDTAIPIDGTVLVKNSYRVEDRTETYSTHRADAAADPDILELAAILDNLDPNTRNIVLTMVRALNRGR